MYYMGAGSMEYQLIDARLTRSALKLTIYRTRREHAYRYNADALQISLVLDNIVI